MRRSLSLRRETLAELTSSELTRVVAGETWSCNCTQVSCVVCLPTGTEKIVFQTVEIE